MRRLNPSAGFTVIEMMVAVAVLGLLSALAAPALKAVMQNNRIRAAGVSLQNGLALARSEAVRLNTQVEFVITNTGWNIQRASGGLLQQASGKERADGITVVTAPANSTRATFDAFGRRVDIPTDMDQIDLAAVKPASGVRPLRVQLVPGGIARLCDPKLADTEPKACL